ncbi:RNA-directed DNA polymerase, eukaryota [Tanacetum coccineum]
MSGGIICLWNNLVFLKSNIICNENYIVVDGFWIPNDVNIRWILVYAPKNLSSKIALWFSLSNLIANWDGMLVMMGDFNEVRKASERYGLVFNDRQAKFFNEFINDASLIDISCRLGERHNGPSTMMVLSMLLKHGTMMVLSMPTVWSCSRKSYRTSKKLFGSGLVQNKSDSYDLKKDHQKRLSSIDAKIDHDCASEEDFKNRRDSLTFLGVIDRMEAKDLAQKAKIKWALEGDEPRTAHFLR